MGDNRIKLFPLKPYQRAVFYSPAKLAVCEATTKAGKTVGALWWLLCEALEDKEASSSLYLTYVYSQAEKMHERLCRWLTKADPGQTWWDSRRGKKLTVTIKHAGFDSVINFMGSDNYDAIYGSDYRRLVVDEASRMRAQAWHAARSTVTATSGWVRIIGNVKGRRNWAYQLARRAEAGEPGMTYHRMTADDAIREGTFKAEDLEAAKRDYPEAVFRELYYGEATEDGSNPFGIQHIAACVGEMSKGEPVAFGIDLGKSQDWTVVMGCDHLRRVCVLERWKDESWERTCERIQHIVGSTPALADATGLGGPVVERLNAASPNIEPFVFTPRSKQGIIENLAVSTQHHDWTFPDGVLRQEMESFEYALSANGLGAVYSAPDGMHDDTVCAAAMMLRVAGDGAAASRGVYVGELGDMLEGVEI